MGAVVATLSLATAAAALAAYPGKGAHFAGETSQDRRISFSTSQTGQRIVDLRFYLVTRCSPTHGHSYINKGGHAPADVRASIRGDGRFSWRAVFPKRHYKAGYTASATFALHGTFLTSTTASGTIKGTARYYPSGEVCSGSASFTVTGPPGPG